VLVSVFHEPSRDLNDSMSNLEGVNTAVQAEIRETLFQLQFQDRVCQILRNIIRDMQKFEARDSVVMDKADIETWLRNLEATYTTMEEIHHHKGSATASVGDSTAASAKATGRGILGNNQCMK